MGRCRCETDLQGGTADSQKDLGQRKQCQKQFLSCFPWRREGKLQFSSSGSCSFPLTCLSPPRLFTFPTFFRTATARRTQGALQSALSRHLSFILGLLLITFLSVLIQSPVSLFSPVTEADEKQKENFLQS